MAQSGPNRPTVLQGKGKQTRTSQRTTTLLLLERFGQSIDPLGQLALLSLRGTLLLSLELTNASCKLIDLSLVLALSRVDNGAGLHNGLL